MGGLFLAFCIALYFLPSIIGRNKSNFGAILVLNLLLGWTFIGWIVALVWALTTEPPRVLVVQGPPQVPMAQQSWRCAGCNNPIQIEDKFCPSCGRELARRNPAA